MQSTKPYTAKKDFYGQILKKANYVMIAVGLIFLLHIRLYTFILAAFVGIIYLAIMLAYYHYDKKAEMEK